MDELILNYIGWIKKAILSNAHDQKLSVHRLKGLLHEVLHLGSASISHESLNNLHSHILVNNVHSNVNINNNVYLNINNNTIQKIKIGGELKVGANGVEITPTNKGSNEWRRSNV